MSTDNTITQISSDTTQNTEQVAQENLVDTKIYDINQYDSSQMLELFTFIYENNIWGNDFSQDYAGSSGPGSFSEYNVEYANFLRNYIINNKICVINELGCGTFLSGPEIYDGLNVIYNGFDIYSPIIEVNNNRFLGEYNTNFHVLDFYNQMDKIPYGDLIILKDVFTYWTNECIQKLLTYIIQKKLCYYILITNCCYQSVDNLDVNLGNFRPLSSRMSPLKDFNAISLFKYKTKEVLLISLV